MWREALNGTLILATDLLWCLLSPADKKWKKEKKRKKGKEKGKTQSASLIIIILKQLHTSPSFLVPRSL